MSANLGSRNYHIIWIDIVKSVPPGATSVDQYKKQQILIDLISKCKAFKNAGAEAKKRRDRKWWLVAKDTGDGYFICFSTSVAEPYSLAIELHQRLKKRNEEARFEKDKFSIRIGLHSGLLILRQDILGKPDLSGDPLPFVNRVCGLGEEWHILASENFGRDIKRSGLFKQKIKHIGTYLDKHGRPMRVYNIFGESIGNRLPPLAPESVPFDATTWYESEAKNLIHPQIPYIELIPFCASGKGYYPFDFEFTVVPNDFELDSSLIPKVKRLKDWIAISRRIWNGDEARLYKIEQRKDGKIVLYFQKTKYFLGLLTNFFIDAKFKEWQNSLRATLAPDPLPSLAESLCSNHLAVNCIIETSEENPKIFLQKASSKIATSPGQLGPSASGSLTFWHSGSLNVGSKDPPSPFKGMMHEIVDELNLSPEDIIDMKLMTICRALQFGGKPSAFFVAKTKLSFSDVQKRWKEARERWEASGLKPIYSNDLKKINELIEQNDNVSGPAKANLHYYLIAHSLQISKEES